VYRRGGRKGKPVSKPLCIDIYCGLGGWAEGFLTEGYTVVGFDIERHDYGTGGYPGHLVIQDVLTLHGSQFKDADIIVASPPCTEFSYMAMPWTRAKQIARALRGEDEFPEGYRGSRTLDQLTALFDACFRIQREACKAAGRYIPLIVENVRGAIPWVGRSQWHYGSFHLWGDVPALMPITLNRQVMKQGVAHRSNGETNFHGHKSSGNSPQMWKDREGGHFDGRYGLKNPGFRFDGSGRSFQTESVMSTGYKSQGLNWSDRTKRGQDFTRVAGLQSGMKSGRAWYAEGLGRLSSKSDSRKAASAQIAKIPLPLSSHIARCFKPQLQEAL